MFRKVTSLILLTFCFAGCSSLAPLTEQDVKDRFQAAKSIKVNSDRDEALSSLAVKAAKQGMYEITENILIDIGLNNLRDSTRQKCAIILANQGKTAEATRIAKSIGLNDLRDKTLIKIAK